MPAVSTRLRARGRDKLVQRGVKGADGAADGDLAILSRIRGPPSLPNYSVARPLWLSDPAEPRELREGGNSKAASRRASA